MNKIATILGLLGGIALLLYWGGDAPGWLLKLECVVVMVAALFFGFTAYSASAPDWLRHDAVRGTALVYFGVGVMFTDPRVLLSSLLIGCGCKLIMKSGLHVTARVTGQALARRSTDIVIKEEAGITRR